MTNRFKKPKKPNYKRGIILVLALFLILYLWLNVESIVTALFSK
ncbi:hypothetical protein [Lutibacter sp.]